MKSNLFKSIAVATALIATAGAATAQTGDGLTSGTAFTICKTASTFKLTTQDYPTGYTFNWTDAAGAPAGTTGSSTGTGTIAGTYSFDATDIAAMTPGTVYSYSVEVISADPASCNSEVKSFFVKVIDPQATIALDGSTAAAYCQEDITGTTQEVSLVATTGSTSSTLSEYVWSAGGTGATVDAATTTVGTNTGDIVKDIAATTSTTYTFGVKAKYTVNVAPSGGCISPEATVTITVNPRPVAPTATISGS